ncbi:MAG: class I SAM-dependent methyltransferase [Actinomycetota bacterium]
MDDIGAFNRRRWDELVAAGCEYTRPWLHLDPAAARTRVDPEHQLADLVGSSVLCLAAGGGQQSVAFGLLGCEVTVLDASESQLEHDRTTAERYGLMPRLVHGDMRDLSMLADGSIDVVWQAHSLNFVPDPRPVFEEVARVLRSGGQYRLQFTNPFIHGTWDRRSGGHYLLAGPYVDGEVKRTSPWRVDDGAGAVTMVEGPREFKHTLSTVLNGVTAVGLEITGFWEDTVGDTDAEAGSWPHFKRHCAPWLTVWSRRS